MKALYLVTVLEVKKIFPGSLLEPDIRSFEVPVWADDANEAQRIAVDFYTSDQGTELRTYQAGNVRQALGSPLGEAGP